jgi:hypothetical protein
MEHIKDFEFQEYFENGGYSDNIEMHDHLSVCDSCKDEFKQYERLYKSLKVEPDWSLPDDFAEAVVSAIPSRAETKFGFLLTETFMYIACSVILLSTCIYYLNFKAMSLQVYNYVAEYFTLTPLQGLLSNLSTFLQPGMTSYILTSGLALIIIGIFDKFILQRKYNRVFRH